MASIVVVLRQNLDFRFSSTPSFGDSWPDWSALNKSQV